MSDKLFIPILLGTGRDTRQSEKVAKFVLSEFEKQPNIETELVDVRDALYEKTTPPWGPGGADEKSIPWKETMERADGLIIVSPEYNHGYPGELKLFLDSIYGEYTKKPVSICGVSNGGLGGSRMVEGLHQVLIEFQMVIGRNAVYFSGVDTLFDSSGKIKDDAYIERVQGLFDELLWYANALKVARDKDSK